ncbi:hypothetical protein CDAR_298141 [Caerostris darwini]|uniref:Uncharacterized protein n=1 Tax=Caerostris darwini TaxID=1538125 RepID=A0AAV4Q0U1_9ARAC|nr:hypothetical protein CDAR_298141 [Caerostris darwini]
MATVFSGIKSKKAKSFLLQILQKPVKTREERDDANNKKRKEHPNNEKRENPEEREEEATKKSFNSIILRRPRVNRGVTGHSQTTRELGPSETSPAGFEQFLTQSPSPPPPPRPPTLEGNHRWKKKKRKKKLPTFLLTHL